MPPTQLSNEVVRRSFLFGLIFFVTLTANASVPATAPASDTVFLSYFLTQCAGDNFLGAPVLEDTTITGFSAGNSGTDTVFTWILEVVSLPDFSFSADTFLCTNTSSTVEVVGTYADYQWSNGQSGKTISIDQDGWYIVTVTNSIGCQGIDSFEFKGVEIELQVSSENPSCAGLADGFIEIASIGTNSPGPHSYYLNQALSSSGSLFPNLAGGDYVVKVIDAAGCSDSLFINLTDPEPFEIDLGPDLIISAGAITQFAATTNTQIAQYNWAPAAVLDCYTCPMPNLLQAGGGFVYLSALDQTGCAAFDTIQLILDPSIPLYVPTAFSPNGDGQNDWLTISAGSSIQELKRLHIFDRWGNLVFGQQKIMAGPQMQIWDGYFRSKKPIPGTYTWFASILFSDNSTVTRSGTFTLIL